MQISYLLVYINNIKVEGNNLLAREKKTQITPASQRKYSVLPIEYPIALSYLHTVAVVNVNTNYKQSHFSKINNNVFDTEF